MNFNSFIEWLDGKVWGTTFEIAGFPVPMLILLILSGGILLTFRLGGLQIFRLPLALRFMVLNEDSSQGAKGEVTSFQALCTALSATIGTGNIVGVATAYVTGGPGALFWMWLAAFFGMATKYAEGLLAIKYRDHDPKTGHVLGGPFYYIERGMGPRWKPLARIFAVFGMLVGLMGVGTFTQVNSICGSVQRLFDPNSMHVIHIFGAEYTWVMIITSVVLAFLVGVVVIGGLRRIAQVSEKVIPLMVVLYVSFAVLLIACNITKVPAACLLIVQSAFGLKAVQGGALGAIIIAMQLGVARGIFSNEAGLGSAPIAAAAARTTECVRQGLVSMTGTFLDTIIVCSMTGLALTLTAQPYQIAGATQGAAATMSAFQAGLPFLPALVTDFVVMLSLILFGFTTILGWNYYSERCLEYLVGKNKFFTILYRWLYILAVFIGPYMTISAVWNIADIFNGLMAIPNMIALIALSGVVVKETKKYFEK